MALLDSDDYWLPDHLASMAAAITETGGRAAFYFADLRRTPQEGEVRQWERASFAIDPPHELLEDATEWTMLPIQPMMLQVSVFHRERFLASGGLWEALPMRDDSHLFFKLCIQGSACAVAQIGAQMTSDDDSGRRLTTAVGSRTRAYWLYSLLMFSDLLNRFPDLAAVHRRDLRMRLALSHLRLAGLGLRDRQPLYALGQLARSVFTHPGPFAKAVSSFVKLSVRKVGRQPVRWLSGTR